MPENPPPTEPAPEDPTQRMSAGDPLGGDVPPPPPPPAAAAPRRFLRSSSDRVVAGVAGGLARHSGIDPTLVRIALVVLTFTGGAGALLYLAAVLLVPAEDAVPDGAVAASAPPTPGERNRWLVLGGVVLLVAVAGPLLVLAGGLLVPLAVLALAGIAVAWLATGRRPEREAGALLRATIVGLGILAVCGVLAVAAFWAAGIGGEGFVAGAVIAAGVAVLAGAFLRPVRWLVPLALAVALPAAFVAAAGIDLDGGIGERSYRPATADGLRDRYELGAGELVLDLRTTDLGVADRRVELDVGMGEAVVLVPGDVCVAASADVGMGEIDLFDRDTSGIDVDVLEEHTAKPGNARIVLHAEVGIGHLDIRQAGEDDVVFSGTEIRRGGEWDWERPRPAATGCRGQ